jgi:hypothetical protein
MSEPTDLVDRQVAAYQARDIDGFLSFYAEDVKVRNFDGHVMAGGLDGMRAFYGPLFRESPQLSVKILNRIALRAYVIDEEVVSGISRRIPGRDACRRGLPDPRRANPRRHLRHVTLRPVPCQNPALGLT